MAAVLDSDALDAAPEWGAPAFVAHKRRRLRIRELPQSIPVRHVNFLILGPAGAGKSSLILTAHRALSGATSADSELQAKLQVDWSQGDTLTREASVVKPGGLRARHGTTSLAHYTLQRRPAARLALIVQDTKGHQFYDESERNFAQRLVDGELRSGSTQDRESLYFWALISRAGLGRFVKRAELATSPHAVVLVFDVTLRSFAKAVADADKSAQIACYRQIAQHARTHGLATFVVLTHVDVYEAQRASSHDDAERRVGESVSDCMKVLASDLSNAIGNDLLPAHRVFPITNYHAAAAARNVRHLHCPTVPSLH